MRVWIPDPESAAAYPIVTYSWLLVKQRYADAGKREAMKSLIRYCLTEGQQMADALGYIPVPDSTAERALALIGEIE